MQGGVGEEGVSVFYVVCKLLALQWAIFPLLFLNIVCFVNMQNFLVSVLPVCFERTPME